MELKVLVGAAAIWLLLTLGSLIVVARVALSLPADYFVTEPAHQPWSTGRVLRNLAGGLLVLLGLLLSVPGIPGQGLLTLVVGLFLVDFPGRRRVELALARRPPVLGALNRLRTRFNRPPLQPPPDK